MAPIEGYMKTQEEIKAVRHPRVALSKEHMVTEEEINHMAPTILTATHNMSTEIED